MSFHENFLFRSFPQCRTYRESRERGSDGVMEREIQFSIMIHSISTTHALDCMLEAVAITLTISSTSICVNLICKHLIKHLD